MRDYWCNRCADHKPLPVGLWFCHHMSVSLLVLLFWTVSVWHLLWVNVKVELSIFNSGLYFPFQMYSFWLFHSLFCWSRTHLHASSGLNWQFTRKKKPSVIGCAIGHSWEMSIYFSFSFSLGLWFLSAQKNSAEKMLSCVPGFLVRSETNTQMPQIPVPPRACWPTRLVFLF